MVALDKTIFDQATQRGMRKVLIVTALPLEMRAVRAHLTEIGSYRTRDGNFVELGQFSAAGQDWVAVVVESGAGNHEAQSAYTYTAFECGPFDISIFVGVAGSRKPDDAPIGCVVASSQVYLPYSGKYKDGAFGYRPEVLNVDAHLVKLARKVARDAAWQARIRPLLRGAMPTQKTYPKPYPPDALIAPIVSTEAVSADEHSELERLIALHCNDACAVEMEGYGALFAARQEQTPTIVVRGISDARVEKDPKLDAIYQPIAAMHAAAFAFELLQLWGENYPASLPVVGQLAAVDELPLSVPTPELAQDLDASDRTEFVLSLAGTAEDFPPTKQDEILSTLKRITGDESLMIVGSRPGSFYLFLQGSPATFAALQNGGVEEELSRLCEVSLLAVFAADEFEAFVKASEELSLPSEVLLNWPKTLPDGTWILRPELSKLLERVSEDEGSTTALIGEPGSGKSALLATFALELQKRQVPFLAIKADALDTDVKDERDLQKSLGLDQLPSDALAIASTLKPAVLIIDQLDALAGYVDLKTGRLNALLNLVRKVGRRRNVHVVLSSRAFEYEHDARLKSVSAEALSLDLPPWSTVLGLLEERGVKAAGWPADAQQMMRSPQALSTFLKLSAIESMQPFETYQAMLERLWRDRILVRPGGAELAKLVARVAEDMAEREALWLPVARYDQNVEDIDVLVAQGILTKVGNETKFGFSHQTIFDHALARTFAQSIGHLSSFVLARESSLFVRPKIWSALTYLRGVDSDAYLVELRAIWRQEGLRRHLRHLLIEFLGQQREPSDGEALLMDAAFQSKDRRVALTSVVGSPGWFQRLKRSVLPQAMTDVVEAGIASAILWRAWKEAPADVHSLLANQWQSDPQFDRFTWHVLQNCQNWTDQTLAIAKSVLKRSEISSYEFDYTILTVGVEQPTVAIELASYLLGLRVDQGIEEASRRLALSEPADMAERVRREVHESPREAISDVFEQSNGWDSLEALAKASPKDFLDSFWPILRKGFESLRRTETEDRAGYPLRFLLDFRFEEESRRTLGDKPILGAIRTAVEELAQQDEAAFLDWLARHEAENAAPAQRLFAAALLCSPERYASRALKFLLEDENRWHIGSIEDYSGTAKRLVAAVSPHWSSEEIGTFVEAVLSYKPTPPTYLDAKLRRYFLQDVRRLKLELLQAMPQDRLSVNTSKYVQTEERRFSHGKRGATFSEATWIGSPISASDLAKAKDADILNAFAEMPDATEWNHPRHWMKGGNVQLSREFAEFSKANQARAIGILDRLDALRGTRAAAYAIDAMAETSDVGEILSLVDRLERRGFAGEEYRGSVARGIERLVDREVKIDDRTKEILEGWLADVSPPVDTEEAIDSEDILDTGIESKKEDRVDSVLWGMGGFAILPHGNFPVLEALFRIYLQRKQPEALITFLRSHLLREEREEVWAALLRMFRYLRPADPAVLGKFIEDLFQRYPGLAAGREAAILFAYVHWQIPDVVWRIISQWRDSDVATARRAFGELVGLVFLVRGDTEWAKNAVNEIVENGPDDARAGLAYAASNLWSESKDPSQESELMQRLIPVASEETWSAVIDVFRLVDEISPSRAWVGLLQSIAQHVTGSAKVSSTFIVERLQTLLPHEAVLVAEIALALVSKWRDELGDPSTGTSGDASTLVDIAITLHRLGAETREMGTQLFEDLLEVNTYGARETLQQIDNRFRETPTSRPLLPRRRREARRKRAA